MNWLRVTGSLGGRWKALLGLQHCMQAVAMTTLLLLAFLVFPNAPYGGNNAIATHSAGCNFPAIFNFGDSNSDTGGKSALFRRYRPPNGESFFGKPAGRECDGRLVVDFIAEKLGLPYLSAYLDSVGTNYRHGANFATGGSTIQPLDARIFKGGFSPISLDVQVLQFEQFKERTIELYNQGGDSYAMSHLPMPEDFSNALYTFDIGQNDIHAGLRSMTEKELLASIPNIIDLFVQAVETLYQLGARTFWIHNTGPFGCLPIAVMEFPPEPSNIDQFGCAKSHNEIAQEFNKVLQARVSQLRKKLPEAVLTYTNMYAAKYTLISDAKERGFANPLAFCCGHSGDYRVYCGHTVIVNGTEIFGGACSHPEEYISWDSVHYSQAANRIIASKILDGVLSDPATPITEACLKPHL